jgi:hypothetical protein
MRHSSPGMLRWRLEVTGLAAAVVLISILLTSWPSPAPRAGVPAGLRRTASGLVAADAFGRTIAYRTLEDRYVFNGSARPGVGYAVASGTGLHVGVGPHRGWQGWFAVTIHAAGPAVVWHTVMSPAVSPVNVGTGEAVFAVQTATTQSNGALNYVVVAAVSRHGLSHWLVGYAHGAIAAARTRVLWRSATTRNPPTAEPVTVATDGYHHLGVWLAGRRVYHSSDLQLDIPPPFQAYLEVQGDNAGYVSSFHDFWIARAAPLQIDHLPPGAAVSLMRSGETISRSTADPAGRARLYLPPPHSVGVADLVVASPGLTRTYHRLSYAGGDTLTAG